MMLIMLANTASLQFEVKWTITFYDLEGPHEIENYPEHFDFHNIY